MRFGYINRSKALCFSGSHLLFDHSVNLLIKIHSVLFVKRNYTFIMNTLRARDFHMSELVACAALQEIIWSASGDIWFASSWSWIKLKAER